MSHEIETASDGRAAFASARLPGWHRLGTVLDHEMTAVEALETAHLARWNVRKEPLTTSVLTDDGVTTLEIPDKFASVRNSPFTGSPEVLGVVGRHYTPVQNEQHIDLLDALVDGGSRFETAGSLKGGRETFVTMKVPAGIQVGGLDPVDVYLAALNTHDGSKAFRFIVTPVRIVCANTQAAALRQAKSTFGMRHTKGGTKGVVQAAREALELTFKYMKAFEREAEILADITITDGQFESFLRDLLPIEHDASPLLSQRNDTRREGIRGLFNESTTIQKDFRNTAWGAYQAVTEYYDHFNTIAVRSGEDSGYARALNVLGGEVQEKKAQAFDMLVHA